MAQRDGVKVGVSERECVRGSVRVRTRVRMSSPSLSGRRGSTSSRCKVTVRAEVRDLLDWVEEGALGAEGRAWLVLLLRSDPQRPPADQIHAHGGG